MRNDFIFDLETIGQNVFKCPIAEVSYFTFSWDRFLNEPYTFKELVHSIVKNKLDIKEQVEKYDCSYTQEDVKFWLQLPEECKALIKPSKYDMSLDDMFYSILRYIRDTDVQYWWSRSNSFDPPILWRLAEKVGRWHDMNAYLPFWKVRDTRTFIDAKLNFPEKNGFIPMKNEDLWNKYFIQHDSRHDLAADILRLQLITRIENGLDNEFI